MHRIWLYYANQLLCFRSDENLTTYQFVPAIFLDIDDHLSWRIPTVRKIKLKINYFLFSKEVKSSVADFEVPYFKQKAEPYSTRLLDNSCSSFSFTSLKIGPVPVKDLFMGKCMLPAELLLLVFGILMISLGTISFILLVLGFDPTTEELEEKLKPDEENEDDYITEGSVY